MTSSDFGQTNAASQFAGPPSPRTHFRHMRRADVPLRFHPSLDTGGACGIDNCVAEIIDFAVSERGTFLDLGWVGLPGDQLRRLLDSLIYIRTGRKCDLHFRGDVPSSLSKAEIGLLRRAGFVGATVRPVPPTSDKIVDSLFLNLNQLARVKWLHEFGIAVTWDFYTDTDDLSQFPNIGYASLFDVLHHLPAPRRVQPGACGSICESNAALQRHESACTEGSFLPQETTDDSPLHNWRTNQQLGSLTYCHGPEFMRIFDRRRGYSAAEFITVTGRQVDLLLFLEVPRIFAEVAGVFNDVPSAELHRFLNRLIARRLIISARGDLFQSVLVRRAQEEKWAYEAG